MVYGITDDTMYLHGALANALIGSSVNVDICVTVTIVDGLVFAKTPFNHSMNYRSVVVRGQARLVADSDEVLRALQLMTLARPATIPRARVAETGQKRIPIIQLIGVKQARAFYGSAS
jgi:nitroimidazol reductase NimA-like FMN-containing flavoprotein (pyridoxamine 5'-phosphate oxidase superfamily)